MPQTVYSSCSLPYTTGCFLFSDSGLTTPVSNGIFSDGVNTYEVTGGLGEITSVSTCAAATTTTTTTSTTTTTTTAAPAQVLVTNQVSGVDSITGVTINGVSVIYSLGTDFPINAGDPVGEFTSTQTGTYTIDVFYYESSATPTMNITIFDSNLNDYCPGNLQQGNNVLSFVGAYIDNITPIQIISAAACQ